MLQINRLDSTDADFAQRLSPLLRVTEADEALKARVREIIQRVQVEGDRALLDYTRDLDHNNLSGCAALQISKEQIRDAVGQVPQATLTALKQSANRIQKYAERQKLENIAAWNWEEEGVCVGQRVTPIDSVGLYIPEGRRHIHLRY